MKTVEQLMQQARVAHANIHIAARMGNARIAWVMEYDRLCELILNHPQLQLDISDDGRKWVIHGTTAIPEA